MCKNTVSLHFLCRSANFTPFSNGPRGSVEGSESERMTCLIVWIVLFLMDGVLCATPPSPSLHATKSLYK